MKNSNTGKIVGGFLAGAGIITYLLASEAGKKMTKKAAGEAQKLVDKADAVVEDAKESGSSIADHVMDFIVSNRPMVESAVTTIINGFLKKK